MSLVAQRACQQSLLFLPLLRGTPRRGQVERRVDQRDVGERLREVPEQTFLRRIVLFGEQADFVGEGAEALEQPRPLFHAALERVVVRQPERAAQERSL